jgi:hypothetical protein
MRRTDDLLNIQTAPRFGSGLLGTSRTGFIRMATALADFMNGD